MSMEDDRDALLQDGAEDTAEAKEPLIEDAQSMELQQTDNEKRQTPEPKQEEADDIDGEKNPQDENTSNNISAIGNQDSSQPEENKNTDNAIQDENVDIIHTQIKKTMEGDDQAEDVADNKNEAVRTEQTENEKDIADEVNENIQKETEEDNENKDDHEQEIVTEKQNMKEDNDDKNLTDDKTVEETGNPEHEIISEHDTKMEGSVEEAEQAEPAVEPETKENVEENVVQKNEDQAETYGKQENMQEEETDLVTVPTGTPEPEKIAVATDTEKTEENHETDPHAPSPVSQIDLSATATVKFVLMPSGQVATLRCHLGQTTEQLKKHFAVELKMPPTAILMLCEGKTITNDVTLSDLGVGPNGTIQLEIQSSDPVGYPIRPVQKRTEYHMPDVITVRVQTVDGTYRDVVVEIERPVQKKLFLGGYKHKKTGVVFHHASVQTVPKPRPPSSVPRFCRDTQTAQQRHQIQQTSNSTCTQMTNIGVYVSNMQDKLLVPGKYTTADEHHSTVQRNVVIIQKYYRRWLAQRLVEKVKNDKQYRAEWEHEQELRKKKKVPTATLR